MDWIKCEPGHMPEDDERYKGKKVINVLVTTGRGNVTKVQRLYSWDFLHPGEGYWYWGRIDCEMRAWMPLPEPYKE